MQVKVLITGSGGFIGYHVAKRLLSLGHDVIGIDRPSINKLKRDRLSALTSVPRFVFHQIKLEEADRLNELLAVNLPRVVIHLGAQKFRGVDNLRSHIDSNIVGTFNLLEACRLFKPDHLLIASSSAVYGNGVDGPLKESAESSRALSLYAATKKASEVIAHSYAHLHGIPTTILRLFTVYGPWAQPDMALFKFTAAILEGREIEIYGHGQMARDFIYIDDLVDGVVGLIGSPPQPDATSPDAPFRIVNIGSSKPVDIERVVCAIEEATGRRAKRKYLPMQAGDARHTRADTSTLRNLVALEPATSIEDGVSAFVNWYRSHSC